jgi:hypothetical protein
VTLTSHPLLVPRSKNRVELYHHAPAALPPGKTRYPLYRRLGEPQDKQLGIHKTVNCNIQELILIGVWVKCLYIICMEMRCLVRCCFPDELFPTGVHVCLHLLSWYVDFHEKRLKYLISL